MSLSKALDRTLLLMRDDISDSATDQHLLAALTDTTVNIVANAENLASHSAQSAFVTLALLLARSGHSVVLCAPDTAQIGAQPPLNPGELLEQMQISGADLLPGIGFTRGPRKRRADLTVLFGDTPSAGNSDRTVRIYAAAWRALLTSGAINRTWSNTDWPIGGMAAAALVAPEVFKISMRKLRYWAWDRNWFDQLFAPTDAVNLNLASLNAAQISNLDSIDFVSGGAITNCALYSLLRLPGLVGSARIIEDDIPDLSNLNRNMLLSRSGLKEPKAVGLSRFGTPSFPITAELLRYTVETASRVAPLSDAVFVGVDDIPSRWEVQRAWPRWLGVGATSHFSAMASFHTRNLPCSGCLHPKTDPEPGTIPTVAFVSFWAGLLQATYYLRYLAEDRLLTRDQHFFYTPLRPEYPWAGNLERRNDCPVGCKEDEPRLTGLPAR